MEYLSNIKLLKVKDSDDFWCIIDELCNDNSEFICNRRAILDAYTSGNLYSLTVEETDEMFNMKSARDEIFCEDSFYLLPCFCVKENNEVVIMWTHTRARRNGFAKKLVELLKIKYVRRVLPDSIGFWKKCNVEILK